MPLSGVAAVLTRQALPRTVIVLGCVSLFNDAASEMITPLLPIFLTATLGAGPAIVGFIEGAAEAVASVLKLLSGWLADRGWNAKYLVLGGYAASNSVRPLIGLALAWPFVFALRFIDRVGKGIRTAPRDALIASAAPAHMRGRAFGFHRSMDHAGAVIGPLAAYWLLSAHVPLQQVFYWSVVPGAAVLLLIAFGLPHSQPRYEPVKRVSLNWRALDSRVRAMLIAACGLALASVPEVFVVLWARERGLEVVWIPLLWAAASAVKMLLAWPAGHFSDRYGRVPVLLVAWSARAGSLLALAWFAAQGVAVWALFMVYSGSLALSEAAERSFVGDHTREEQRGTAYGAYHLASGLLVLPGAFLFGWIWEVASEGIAFVLAAVVTAVAGTAMLVGGGRKQG